MQWRVLDSGASPNFPAAVKAGVDRVVVQSGQTYLSGTVRGGGKATAAPSVRWSKDSGPGEVTFGDAHAAVTTARFSATGVYVLRLAADDGSPATSSDTLTVTVDPPPPATR